MDLAFICRAPLGSAALLERPSIAVLPFQNMSGDPEQDYFADGMVEEVITALSRIRWLFVIARNSSFSYKGRSVDLRQVGRELGVRYVLEGSVRKSGNRIRIAAQLIQADSGAHLWAERFDGSLEDVFDLQDKIAANVAGVIEPALQAAETARSARKPTNDLTAYDCYLRALDVVLSISAEIPKALQLLETAINRDANYTPALALAAVCCMRLIQDGRSIDHNADRRKGTDLARRALQHADTDPGTLVNAAMALSAFGEDLSTMTAIVGRALLLNPNFARGWYISGMLHTWADQPEVAIEHFEKSLRLSPRVRFGQVLTNMGIAYLLMGRYEDAIPKFLLELQAQHDFPPAYRCLAACFAHLGRLQEAHDIYDRLRSINPSAVDPSQINPPAFRNPRFRRLLLSGLRLASGKPR
jgi:TolB-like protein